MENISERKHVDIYCHVPHMEVYHKNIETFFLNWMKSGNDLLLLTVVHSVIVLMLLIFVQWFIFKCIYQNIAQIVHRAFEPFPNEMPSLSEVCVLVIITWNPPNEKKREMFWKHLATLIYACCFLLINYSFYYCAMISKRSVSKQTKTWNELIRCSAKHSNSFFQTFPRKPSSDFQILNVVCRIES